MTVRVGIVKLGNLGTSRYIDLILDERADRDIYVRSVGTGAKLGEAEADEAVKEILTFKPQVCIVISPNEVDALAPALTSFAPASAHICTLSSLNNSSRSGSGCSFWR